MPNSMAARLMLEASSRLDEGARGTASPSARAVDQAQRGIQPGAHPWCGAQMIDRLRQDCACPRVTGIGRAPRCHRPPNKCQHVHQLAVLEQPVASSAAAQVGSRSSSRRAPPTKVALLMVCLAVPRLCRPGGPPLWACSGPVSTGSGRLTACCIFVHGGSPICRATLCLFINGVEGGTPAGCYSLPIVA